jgi:anti-anti-sigma regulatory factor
LVPLDAISADGLEAAIDEYNELLALQQGMGEIRSRANRIERSIDERSRENRCTGCHQYRDPRLLLSPTAMNADEEAGPRVLAVHQMAGLLDGRSREIKEQKSHVRGHLRSMAFCRCVGDGRSTFFSVDEVPEGEETDGRRWRLQVGNSPLDTTALVMRGGGAVVGAIPRGLPSLQTPKFDATVIPRFISAAIIISLLGFMEAISIAKAMAAKTGQRLDPNQELIGQGIANIVGSFGRSYPASGSFSRSAVNLQAGAQTGLSSVFTSLTVVVVLLFFTPLLYHLPQAVLAAVIMMAVIGLVNVSGFVHAWKAQRYDGIISVLTFIATLAFAPHLDKGIMIGVGLSVGVFLHKSMRPAVASLSRHHDDSLRAALIHDLEECKYVDVVRFDGPLFFANASYLEDSINERLQVKKHLRHIIIVSNAISDIDASGEETLSLLVDRVRSAGLEISFSGVNEAVMMVLERTHLIERIGRDRIFPTMERAICAVHGHAHHNGDEEECPLTNQCDPRISGANDRGA